MATVSPELIRKLRDATQAGMLDCKKALEENQGDLEKATQWLREKGIAKASKKADAVAREGLVRALSTDHNAFIFELNCETDFTANNELFQNTAQQIAEAIAKHDRELSLEEALQLKLPSGETITEATVHVTAKIGEKIGLRRVASLKKESADSFGIYTHTNGRIAAIVLLKGSKDAEAARGVAMHAAAMGPKFTNSSEVDPTWLENERKILVEQTIASGKPKEFADKIVNGKIAKLLSENCLVDQDYVREPSVKVAEFAKRAGGEITRMVRYEVGEGIEKKEVDFAQEVMSQMKAAGNK